MSEIQEKLADVSVAVTSAEDQREAPKALKKKNGAERPRPRDGYHTDGLRGPPERRTYSEREQSYQRERGRLYENIPDGQTPDQFRPTQALRNGSDGGGSSDLGKATFRNREQELRDPEFQRYRGAAYGMVDPRYRPHNVPPEEMEHMMHAFQSMAPFGHGLEGAGLAYAHNPNTMALGPPYNAMTGAPVGYGYQNPMMQQMPQGMGMYGSAQMPYGYSQIPQQQQYAPAAYPQQFLQPYPYTMQMRPTNGVMQPYAGQQMGQNMVPYYQTFMPQGYHIPGPGPQGGRPGFAGPPRPQQGFPNHALPRNGSGGYNRKPTPPTRPVKNDITPVPPKSPQEALTRATDAPSDAASSEERPTSQAPEIKPPLAEVSSPDTETTQA